MTDPHGTFDDEIPIADRWEQQQDEVRDIDDEEAPVGSVSPDEASAEADPADVHEQSLDVPVDDPLDR